MFSADTDESELSCLCIGTDSLEPTEALRTAAGVERDSEQTIAQAIVKSVEEQRLAVPRASEFEAILGHGVRAD